MSSTDRMPNGSWEPRQDRSANELEAIRQQLDDLVRRRFDHGWTDSEGAAFERLATRERELLDELVHGHDIARPQMPPSPN
jgi:hypothetical protein